MTVMTKEEFNARIAANPLLSAMFEKAVRAADQNVDMPEAQGLGLLDKGEIKRIKESIVAASVYLRARTSPEHFETVVLEILKSPLLQARQLN